MMRISVFFAKIRFLAENKIYIFGRLIQNMRRLISLMAVLLPFFLSAQNYVQQIEQYRQEQLLHLNQKSKGPVAEQNLVYIQHFVPQEVFRAEANVEYLYNEPTFRMPTLDGTSKTFKRFALLHFSLQGKSLTLTAYQSVGILSTQVSPYLFLPFLDLTTGETTYESGRYLDVKISDIQADKLILDFNKAYNPYCAYSSGYRCPQPPLENFLDVAIEAGEKKYTGPKHQREQDNSMAKNFNDGEKELILSGGENDKMYVLQTTVEKDSIILRTLSDDIKFDDPLLPVLASRMLATVQNPEQAGVGIAAPQVGVNKNAIWVQRFDKEGSPFEFYINPKIVWRSKLLRKGAEGCLSIPDRREDVIRNYSIKLQYTSKEGKTVDELIEGFTAVIFQHEVDHLYAILYPDRLEEQQSKDIVPLAEKIEFSIEKGTILP